MTMGHGASQSPEALLEKALSAGSASLRAKYATHGLRQPTLGPDTHVLLLRQLYLAHLERGHFAEARGVAEQMVALGELVEPALHDAARACIAQGDLASAAGHLRVAARSAPAQRRALHLWTLGRVLYLNEQYAEAVAAFERALRWATGNQTLYRAHIALAKARLANLGRGEVSGLRDHYEALTKLDPLPLYAEYVAAELLRELDREALANDLLRRFIKQAERSPIETAVGLRAEIERAKRWLSQSP
jgi:tetratricopeptide (TPR) repeat protein